jgi:hypothetical protein
MPEEHARAAKDFLSAYVEFAGSVGRHEGHVLSKAGQCVYCSCGFRYQGTLPSAKDRADAREAYAEMQAGPDGT